MCVYQLQTVLTQKPTNNFSKSLKVKLLAAKSQFWSKMINYLEATLIMKTIFFTLSCVIIGCVNY